MEGEKERMQEQEDVSLKELREKLAEFARERGWEKFHNPRNLLLSRKGEDARASGCQFEGASREACRICERERVGEVSQTEESPSCHGMIRLKFPITEVGELSEIFQWRGEVAKGLPDWEERDKEHLGEELSDVLLYLVQLADACEVDLGDAATKKLAKNAVKYPANLSQQ
ncbi:dCTP pyrophosphatase 1 [Nymphaea thermarum]|nr:dCTP pyrophosphatase 1 [Nymphaea thermarum]